MTPDLFPTTAKPVLTLDDLNTTVNHEPRIRDLRLAELLGMANPHSIRDMVRANEAELSLYGSISAAPRMIETGKGAQREVTEYYLNEGQAILICMFSRTERAALVRKAVIDVFTAWRKRTLPAAPPRKVPVKAHVRTLPGPVPEVITIRHMMEWLERHFRAATEADATMAAAIHMQMAAYGHQTETVRAALVGLAGLSESLAPGGNFPVCARVFARNLATVQSGRALHPAQIADRTAERTTARITAQITAQTTGGPK